MRNFFSILLLFASVLSYGQTTLSAGDLIFIGYNSIGSNAGAPNYVAFMSRVPIESNTVVYVSNETYNSSSSSFSITSSATQGTIQLTFTEPVSVGQIVEITFNVGTGALASTVGTPTYSSGTTFDFGHGSSEDEVYVYQVSGGTKTFITGLVWSASAPASNVPAGLDFSTSSSKNAFYIGSNGNSLKCGVWSETSASRTAVPFTESLHTGLYDDTEWIYVTSNTFTSGVCPCNPDTVHASNTNSPYDFVESSITFDKYRWGAVASTWQQYDGSNWQNMGSAPDWASTTRTKEVQIFQDLTLGSFTASSPTQTIYECATLSIRDSINDGVTLTITPGNSLKVHYSQEMYETPSAANNKPHILLQSDISTEATPEVYYGTVSPTTAKLNGTYKMECYISDPGWHHFISPIQTKLNQVSFTAGSSSTFSFNYTGSSGNRNVYWWDGDNASEVFWQPTSSTTGEDYFSDRPYTIYFTSDEVPTKMSVTGQLKHRDQDSTIVQNVLYQSVGGSTTSPGYGAPSWTTANKDGWNFYGNPYATYIETASLITNYGGAGKDMQNLNSAVYVWDPNRIGINTSNYVSNTGSQTNESTFIAPFQAFFMRTNQTSNGSNGFVKGKKYRVTTASTPTVTNKTSSMSELCLELRVGNHQAPYRIYAEPRTGVQPGQYVLYGDAYYSGSWTDMFAILSDSSFYAVKCVPNIEDSAAIHVAAIHPTHGESITIQSGPYQDINYTHYLYDRVTQNLHNLTQPYTFTSDTTWQDYRFEWFIFKNTSGIDENVVELPSYWAHSQGQDVIIQSDSDGPMQVDIFNLQGQRLTSIVAENGDIIYHSQESQMLVVVINGRQAFKFWKS